MDKTQHLRGSGEGRGSHPGHVTILLGSNLGQVVYSHPPSLLSCVAGPVDVDVKWRLSDSNDSECTYNYIVT